MSLNRKASILFLISVALFLTLSAVLLPAIVKTAEQQLLFNSLFVSIPSFLIPAILFRRKLRFPRFKAPLATHVLLAIVAGVGCIMLNEALYCLNEAMLFGIDIQSASISADTILGMNTLVMFVALALIPPVSEELMMRGTMLETWRRTSPWGAALLTALFFALLHAAPSAFIIYFGMGILFAMVYLITRNVYLTMIIHFVNNLASVLSAWAKKSGMLNAGAEAMEAMQQYTSSRAGYIELFLSYALYAALLIAPALVLLDYSCKKRGLGRYAPEEPIGAAPEGAGLEANSLCENKGSLWKDPVVWVTLAVLLILNVISALFELGILKLK